MIRNNNISKRYVYFICRQKQNGEENIHSMYVCGKRKLYVGGCAVVLTLLLQVEPKEVTD